MKIMKNIIYKLLLFLPLVYLLSSCETDFEVNAEYREIMVIYGLLDHSDSTHYVRISKAFLGDEDANVMAADPENSAYPDILDVKVEEWTNGSLTRTYALNRVLTTGKEPGVFSYPEQYAYTFTAHLNKAAVYKIKVKNNETGYEAGAETPLVGDFTIDKPLYNPVKPQISFVNQSGNYTDGICEWLSAKNGRLYEPVFRFNYRETLPGTGDTTSHTVNWRLSSVKSSAMNGGEKLSTTYNGEGFFRILQSSIPEKTGVKRFIGNIDFMISVGGDELSTYIDLNRPSNTIIQERPFYTNINNGIGIFSCRHTVIQSYALSQFTVSKLLSSEYTSRLGF
jgi:hypothetical protein